MINIPFSAILKINSHVGVESVLAFKIVAIRNLIARMKVMSTLAPRSSSIKRSTEKCMFQKINLDNQNLM